MGIIQTPVSSSHWHYFLSLEDDLIQLSRWIEFDAKNFDCFSLELVRLLIVTSSEVDVVAKMLCKTIDANSKAGSINAYRDVISNEYENLATCVIQIPKHGLTLTPWEEWGKPKSPPFWWKANNKVKHHRSDHYHKATLKNVLNSVAGLMVLLMYYYGSPHILHGVSAEAHIMESINVRDSGEGTLHFDNW